MLKMESDDEIIPSSQPLIITKQKTSEQKKRKKSKLALNSSKMAKSSKMSSRKASNSENPKKPLTEINIYVGLLDETIGRNAVTPNKSLDTRKDIFDDVRQLELGTLSNTTPSKKVTMPIEFKSTEGLKSVQSFIETHQFDRNGANISHIQDNKPRSEWIKTSRSELSLSRHEAQQILDENLQFSEWLIEQPNVSIVKKSPDLREHRSELSFVREEAKEFMNESFQLSEWPIEQQNDPVVEEVSPQERLSQHLTLEQSCVSSIVDSILNDFEDEFEQSEEPFLKSPPMILSRKRNPRIYKRLRASKTRQLLWENESCDKESIPNSQSNINIDVDLDSSHRIIENITNLSTFFTHSQAFALDFERDLSQNSDEVENENVEDNITENVSSNENNTQIDRVNFDAVAHFWSDDDDDFLHKVNSPSIDLLKKSTASKRNCGQISTPNSVAETNKRFKMNYATPSTSKAFMENEQRDFLPKRLHFEADGDNQTTQMNDKPTMSLKPLGAKPMNNGFSTAAGTTIVTSTNAMQKQLRVFAGIEAECQQVVECHGSKSPINQMDDKNQCDNQLYSRTISDSNQKVMPTDGFYKKLSTTVGFLTGRGNSAAISDAKLKNSRQLFKNVFDEFGELDTTNIVPKMDFETSSKSSVAMKAKTSKKYQEMEVDIFEDCEAGPSTKVPIESPIVCKTPLSKIHQNSNRFTTSTPNLNGRNNLNSPCITPINKLKRMPAMAREQESIKSLNDTGDERYGNILSDVIPKPIARIPTEAILDVSEINPLDVSISQTDTLCIPAHIKLAREKKLSEQQVNAMKKPHVILPKMGSLCLEKLLSCKTQIEPMKLKLKKLQMAELRQLGLLDSVIELTIENAVKFKFDMWNYYPIKECRSNVDGIELPDDIKLIMDKNSRVGIREISSAFLMCPVVDPKLVPDNWIRNSFKWIVVKLAAMDRAFAYQNNGTYLTPENVMLQLKYRYDREIDKAERPAIRRIVEMDDVAAKRMVLFVSAIYNENDTPRALQLCDGWYAIRTTSLDPTLVKAVQNKKIEIGTKLMIQGAELHGCTEGTHPLEMSSAAALKISANSTRRAKWDLKLGFCRAAWPFAISLNSISEQGGLISRMKAFVLRVYPLVYIVKETVGDSTKSTMRSSKMEKRFRQNEDHKRFEMVEKFYNEANEEIEREDKATTLTMDLPKQKLKEIDNGEDLWKLMEISHDAESFELNLTMTQKQLLQDHQTLMNDKKTARIHKLASEKLKNWSTVAKTTPMFKVRLIDAKNPTISKTSILNIWNATEDMIAIRENTCVEIQKAMAKGMCGRDILITAFGTQSIREIPDYPTEQHTNLKRKLTNLHEINFRTFKPLFNEFDTIGYVVEMTDANPGQFQSIFFIDAHKNFLCIKFWNGVKEYGYVDVVQIGRFLCINHLDWRPQHTTNHNNFPQAFANEYTLFTENPKDKEKCNALEKLRHEFQTLNLDNYISECRSELDKDVSNISNVSIMATTPLRPSNLNSNNLTRTPIDCSPSPQSVENRISRLRSYGDLAAPSKHIYLGARKRLRTKFRTPVKTSVSNAANSTSRNVNQEN